MSEFNENEEQMRPKYSHKYENNISLMTFNPTKENVLCICDNEGNMCLWDINSDNIFNEYNREKNPTRLLWSPNGNFIGICFSDGLLKIYNIIDNKFDVIFEEKISLKESSSNSFIWLSDNSFATIGWVEDNSRNLSIWNNFKKKDNSIFGECSIYSIKINEFDSDIIPFSNKEHNLIYLVNKKEDNLPSIIVYEFKENEILKKSEYFSTHPTAFSILINNNCCDNNKNEIDRFIRYNSDEKKVYFVSIFKKIENECLKEDSKRESEIQKNIFKDSEKGNNDLKIKEEENNSLKKAIEDNNIENNKIIINTYEQKQKELEEEIDNPKDELDKEKYKNEQIMENKREPEKELQKNKLSIINQVPEQLSSINEFTDLIKNKKSISLKLDQYIINRDNNLGESVGENKDNINQEYKIYNLDVVDKNKEIVMIFGNEYRRFTFEKYNE